MYLLSTIPTRMKKKIIGLVLLGIWLWIAMPTHARTISPWLQESIRPFLAECENKKADRFDNYLFYIEQVCPYSYQWVKGTIQKRILVNTKTQKFVRVPYGYSGALPPYLLK